MVKTADFDTMTVEELRSCLEAESKSTELLIKLAGEASTTFTEDTFRDVNNTIFVCAHRMDYAEKLELKMLLRILRYDSYIASTKVLDAIPRSTLNVDGSADVDKYTNNFQEDIKYLSPAEAVLYDADASMEIFQKEMDRGVLPSKASNGFVKDLAVAAEKLRLAIESGDEVEIALEQRATQNILTRIIDAIKGPAR